MPSRNTAPPASDGVIDAPPERAATHRTNRAVACILARSDAREVRASAEAMPGDQLREILRRLAELGLSLQKSVLLVCVLL